MFVRSKETVRDILEGVLDYGKLPYNGQNEKFKGYMFEVQAGVNERLSRYRSNCLALGEECRKEKCLLYKNKIGKNRKGWVCREFQVDYPSAPFNSRFHVIFIGNEKIDKEKTMGHLEYLKKQGAKYICMGCKNVYEEKPGEVYEDGHGSQYIDMCPCGSDIFLTLKSFLKRYSLDH